MVRIYQQNTASRIAFQNWVATQKQFERDRRKETLKGILPGQVVDFLSACQQSENAMKGGIGEAAVFLQALMYLPDTWVMFNDVIIELGNNKFAQLDHVLIGQAGVFIIETKAWRGAFLGYQDSWRRKDQSQGWVKCSSPTTQNLRHARLLRQWLSQRLPFEPPASLELWIVPVVVMTKTQWLRTTECSMPVFLGIPRLLEYLTTREKVYLTPEQISQISQLIVNPPAIVVTNPAKSVTTSPIKKVSRSPIKPSVKKAATVLATACRLCQSHNLSIEFGYSYYFKCRDCGGNRRIDSVCQNCGESESIRKQGLQFYAECHRCGTSALFHSQSSQLHLPEDK
jgi:hypothetical protein